MNSTIQSSSISPLYCYRYGFNGMEKDDEIKTNSGSSYDFGARMYDPRVGRWLSIDPHEEKYPAQTPYNFSLNSPLMFKDIDGRDAIITVEKNGNITTVTITAKVYLTGRGVNDDYANLVQAISDRALGGLFGYTEGDQTYHLKVNVEYIDASASKANSENVSLPVKQYIEGSTIEKAMSIPLKEDENNSGGGLDYGENVVLYDEVNNGMDGAVSGMSESQSWIPIYKDQDEFDGITQAAYTTVHEIFHLLGLSDRYNKKKGEKPVAHDGYDNDWLGPGTADKISTWTTVEFNQDHVKNLVKAALEIYGNDDNKRMSSDGSVFYTMYQYFINNGAVDKNDPNREPADINGNKQ